MGCDIHFHIELKINNKWEHYASPQVDRWYKLFGLLAGVRNMEIEPIIEPKGLPDNLSIITMMDYKRMYGDAHTASWFNANEILKLSETLNEWSQKANGNFLDYDLEYSILKTYLFGNSFSGHVKYDDSELPKGIDDVRFVFWFDN